jgi:hypothetical protein
MADQLDRTTVLPIGDSSDEEDDDSTAESDGRTAEEIEQFWRNRVSKKDKTHAAAERALREEIASLKSAAAASATSSSQDGGTEPVNPQIATLQRELEEERRARVIDQRKAKYPALAAQATDDLFSISDEATLAKLNAMADENSGGGRTLIAPTNPARSAARPPKSLQDMTKDEVLRELQKMSDAEQQAAEERRWQ